jgi:hypothetical protein
VLDPVFGYLIIAGIALLFASAAAHKLRGLAHFSEIFTAYRLLPDPAARRLAWLIPCLELAVAFTLLWEPSRRIAIVSAIAVLLAYASGLALNLFRKRRDLDCGCGAARGRRGISPWMAWRNVLLAAALGIAALPWSDRLFNWTDLLTTAGGLIAGVTLYAVVDGLLGDVAPKAVMLRSAP